DFVATDGVGGEEIAHGGTAVEVLHMAEGAEEGDVGQRHLTWAVGGEGDAGVGAGDFEISAGDDGHLDLVVGADDELGEGGAEGDFAGGGEAGGGGNHILLG